MSGPPDLRLVELVASRICHDVVGPVGAISNGLELLLEVEEGERAEIVDLLMTSARQAWRRLAFFRAAVGHAGGRAEWSAEELHRLVSDWLEDGKSRLQWTLGPEWTAEPIPTPAARVLLLLVAVIGEGLIRGGTLAIDAEAPGGRRFRLVGEGKGALVHDRVRHALAGDVALADLDPKLAPAALAGAIARAGGLAFKLEAGVDRVAFQVEKSGQVEKSS